MKKMVLFLLLFYLLGGHAKAISYPNNHIFIRGMVNSLLPGDSVDLTCVLYGLIVKDTHFNTTRNCIANNHQYYFKLDNMYGPVTISIVYFRKGQRTGGLPAYLAEPGDSILIQDEGDYQNPYHQTFSGKGSLKYSVQNYFILQQSRFGYQHPHFTHIDPVSVRGLDSLCHWELKYLEKFTGKMSAYAYSNLKMSAMTYCEGLKYQMLNLQRRRGDFHFENEYFQHAIFRLASDTHHNFDYFTSLYYFITQKYAYDSATVLNRLTNMKGLYFYIKNFFRGTIREQLITELFFKVNSSDKASCIQNALSYLSKPAYRSTLENMLSEVGIGAIAYNFNLRDTSSQIHSLSDNKKTVVVIDFWFTGCGNCRLLAPFMKKIETLYISKNVQFITISIDKDSSIWKKSIIEGKYTSGMTLNLFTNGLGEEEPVIAKYYIRSYPTIVLIDKQGRIAATPVDPRLDKGKDLINLIDKLM